MALKLPAIYSDKFGNRPFGHRQALRIRPSKLIPQLINNLAKMKRDILKRKFKKKIKEQEA